MRFLLLIITLLSLAAMQTGCYYDVEEELYPPDSTACDLTNITFSGTIEPLIVAECAATCHSNAVMNGNISLEGYQNIKEQAENGNLMGAVRHDPGFSPMPQGGSKLPQCQIESIQKWIDNGTPND